MNAAAATSTSTITDINACGNEHCALPAERPSVDTAKSDVQRLAEHCNLYKGGDVGRSLFQLATTITLFFVVCGIMWLCLENQAVWIAALLSILASGLLVRLFIIQHDCGHGSFFPSRFANNFTGRVLSVLTFTPYDFWRKAHNLHHASSGNLDRRGIGSIDTLTVREYQALVPWKKIAYRLYRNPFVMIIFGTPYNSLIAQRLPVGGGTFNENYRSLTLSQIWKSSMLLNLALVLFYGTLGMLLGFKSLALIVLPLVVMASWIGGWLFFIQHQFEDAYWQGGKDWDFHEAAFMGSSHYTLHPVLQWFTGNIGLHHIHHLCSKIPNYRLQECLDNSPVLRDVNRLTMAESLKCARLALWDEDSRKMVGFSDVRL